MQARTVLQLVLTFVFVGVANAIYCEKIQQKYSPPVRQVTQHGVPKNVTLYYDSDPARAAAVILYVVLRYTLGYQQLLLRPTPNEIESDELCNETVPFKEVNITVSVPSYKRMYVHLAKPYRSNSTCISIDYWSEYSDAATAAQCGFKVPTTSDYMIEIFIITNNPDPYIPQETPCINECYSTYRFNKMSRSNFFQALRKSNTSFLFVDYDMWTKDQKDVNFDTLPPCLDCFVDEDLEMEAVVNTKVSDDCLIKQYAPQIFKVSDKYAPTLISLRHVLEIMDDKDIVETTCEWVSQNYDIVDSLTAKYEPTIKNFTIISIACNDTSDLGGLELYNMILFYLGLYRQKTNSSDFNIVIQSFDLDCTDSVAVLDDINYLMSYGIVPSTIGIAIGNLINIKNVINIMNKFDVPVMLYDTTDIDDDTIKAITSDYSTNSHNITPIWLSNGQPLHVTIAVEDFFHQMGWNRIALMTDQTSSAKFYKDNLINLEGLRIREYSLSNNFTDEEAENLLQKIKDDNGHTVFVNTDYHKAVKVLSAAVKLEMNIKEKYAWVTRDWNTDIALDLTHFVISLSCKKSSDVPSTLGNIEHRYNLDKIFSYKLWSLQAAALANAVLTLIYGFDEVILKYPQARDDTQSSQVIRQLAKSLAKVPVEGVAQTLKYKNHVLEEVVVFIEVWQHGKRQLLKQLRVNSTDRRVTVDYETEMVYTAPDDFTDFTESKCICQVGETCFDSLLVVLMVFIGFIIVLLLWKRITSYRNRVYTSVAVDKTVSW